MEEERPRKSSYISSFPEIDHDNSSQFPQLPEHVSDARNFLRVVSHVRSNRDNYGGQNQAAYNSGYAPSYSPPAPGGPPAGCVSIPIFPSYYAYRMCSMPGSQRLHQGELIMTTFVV